MSVFEFDRQRDPSQDAPAPLPWSPTEKLGVPDDLIVVPYPRPTRELAAERSSKAKGTSEPFMTALLDQIANDREHERNALGLAVSDQMAIDVLAVGSAGAGLHNDRPIPAPSDGDEPSTRSDRETPARPANVRRADCLKGLVLVSWLSRICSPKLGSRKQKDGQSAG